MYAVHVIQKCLIWFNFAKFDYDNVGDGDVVDDVVMILNIRNWGESVRGVEETREREGGAWYVCYVDSWTFAQQNDWLWYYWSKYFLVI